jgi:hypothetical protein
MCGVRKRGCWREWGGEGLLIWPAPRESPNLPEKLPQPGLMVGHGKYVELGWLRQDRPAVAMR